MKRAGSAPSVTECNDTICYLAGIGCQAFWVENRVFSRMAGRVEVVGEFFEFAGFRFEIWSSRLGSANSSFVFLVVDIFPCEGVSDNSDEEEERVPILLEVGKASDTFEVFPDETWSQVEFDERFPDHPFDLFAVSVSVGDVGGSGSAFVSAVDESPFFESHVV